jgi:hypothetical protein
VTAGATTEHEVRLDRGLTLAGTLVDDTGTPIAGAGVLAIGGDPTRRGNHGQALTDPDGRFLIGGLEDRTYDLQSDPDGCDRVGLSEVVPPMAGLVLTAPRRGTVTAFLRLPAGFPTPESVTLFRPASRGSDEMHASSRSWNGGRFEHGNIPTGTVRLRFFVDGLAPAVRELQVTPGERTDLGEIPLDAGLVLEGRIVDRHGRPVARALVSSGVTRDASWRSAVTQADGSFRLERLVAGAVDLHVEADDHLPARIPVTVPLEPPQLVVRLRVAGRLAGEVRNADGSAAARRAVQLHQGKRHVRQLETDEHGRFQAAVPEGSYRVIVPSLWSYGSAGFARPEPGDAAEGEVHVKEAEESKLVLTLSPR